MRPSKKYIISIIYADGSTTDITIKKCMFEATMKALPYNIISYMNVDDYEPKKEK